MKSSQDLGQKTEDVISSFGEAWRNKNWFRVLTTLLSLFLTLCSPPSINTLLTGFNLATLPTWYNWVWGIGCVLLFVGSIVVASAKKVTERFVGTNAIKGLLPFERTDAETFAKLGRSTPLRECLTVLTGNSFRFGILNGESGCGKTSFLRAGVLPRLNARSDFRAVYVEFTNRNPVETIREALATELKPTEVLPPSADLSLLFQAAAGTGKPLILLFDQFEQVFFQSRHSVATDPFFQALANWYGQRMQHGHRILLCWRRDYYYQSTDLLKRMGGSIGFQELFSLEKFTPQQATDVFKVIAEETNLQFDQKFVETMIEEELADTETQEGSASMKVSPVAVQIMAWLVAGQQTTDTRGFDRAAFRELGGVEGLMERFLRRVLEGRGPKGQTDMKVLLTLTNRDTGARAGLLPIGAIQEKDETLSAEDIAESLDFLGSPQARLVIAETTGCKLAHERLIPALLKIAGSVLGPQERANQLLNRRVSAWVENSKDSRFLLGLGEWLSIRKHRPTIVWGNQSQEATKRELLKQSAQRWQVRLGFLTALLVIVLAGYGWLQTDNGQLWQLENTLNQLKESGSDESKVWTIRTIADIGQPHQALADIEVIHDPHKIAECLIVIANEFIYLKDTVQTRKALIKALMIEYKEDITLSAIANAFAKIRDKDGINQTLRAASSLSNDNDFLTGKDKILSAIAKAFADVNDKEGIIQTLRATTGMGDFDKMQTLPAIAEAFVQIHNKEGINQTLRVANTLPDEYQADILIAVAAAFAKLNDYGLEVHRFKNEWNSSGSVETD